MPARPAFSALDHYLLSKPGTLVDYPFNEIARVYKVLGKMFALIAEKNLPLHISLKCDPTDSLALRAEHPAITAAYHMNKKHWNTLVLDGSLPDSLVFELIDHSYALVISGLSQSRRKELGLLD